MFLAPTLMRSQVLETLYLSVRRAEIDEAEDLARPGRFARMKIRYVGDKVLRRRAWDVARKAGWDRTPDAEYLALTQRQAYAFVTLAADLADVASELVATEGMAVLDET